jgi:hypothetical protein
MIKNRNKIILRGVARVNGLSQVWSSIAPIISIFIWLLLVLSKYPEPYMLGR